MTWTVKYVAAGLVLITFFMTNVLPTFNNFPIKNSLLLQELIKVGKSQKQFYGLPDSPKKISKTHYPEHLLYSGL